MCPTRNRTPEALNSVEGELILRFLLVVLFIITEELQPFVRIIHKEEFWLLSNPRTASYYPTWMLTSSAFLVPFLTIYFLSYCRMDKEEAVKGWLAFTFSGLFTAILTNLTKNVVGRPRPDFMNRCFPEGIPETTYAKDGVTLLCNGNPDDIKEGRKSFPSGHSSIMFSSIGFLSFYLARKFNVHVSSGRGEAWRLVVISIPFIFCSLVALSRTCDYHHHWQDVTIGSLLGFFVAFVSFRQYLCPPTDSATNSSNISMLSSPSQRDYFNARKTSLVEEEGYCDRCGQREIEMTDMKNETLVTI